MFRPACLLLVCALLLAACGDNEETVQNDGSEPSTATETTATAEESAGETEDGCRKAEASEPAEKRVKKPTQRLDPDKTWTVVMRTSCGTMEIRLDVKGSPKTTASFANLVRRKFYDGDDFHRVISGFVIQGGDPLNNGLGEPGYQVVEDPGPNTRYPIGAVAMAKSQADPPGASGSQFFIVTGDQTPLDPVYAVVGRVTEGRDVADLISNVATDPATDMPVDPVVIEKATVKNS